MAATMIWNWAESCIGVHPRPAAVRATCVATYVIIAGSALPLMADSAPREALPSPEAIGWLLETEATGAAAPWINSRSGYNGTITITQSWQRADGIPCRTYTVTAVSGGPRITLKGTGCRAATGIWNLTEDAPVVLMAVGSPPPGEKPPAPSDEMRENPATVTPIAPPLVVKAPPDELQRDEASAGQGPADETSTLAAPAGESQAGSLHKTPGAVSAPPEGTGASNAAEDKPLSIPASLPLPSDE